jgi:putative aldouronate transport system substrate-binding protein
MRRLAAALLAALMLLAVAACDSNNQDTTTAAPTTAAPTTEAAATEADAAADATEAEATTAAAEATTAAATTTAAAPAAEVDVMQPFSAYPEPIVISVGRQNNAGGQFAPGESAGDNSYTRMLKDVLNIEIDVAGGFDANGDEYENTLALRAASNTLPDTFGITESSKSRVLFQQLVEGGRLADLTDIYGKAIGGRTKESIDATDSAAALQHMTVGGKLYGVTSEKEGYNTALLWIRKDWLDKCGLEVPKTVEDVTNVALEFVKQKPGGMDNTIGIAVSPDPNGGLFGQWMGVLPVFNALGSYPDIWIDDGTGKAVFGAVQPETKEALAVLASWIQSGVMDKNFVTMKNGDEVRDTYLSTNACGMIFNAWWDPWPQWNGLQDASVNNNEGLEWIPVFAPLNGAGQFVPKNETISTGGQVVLASFEHPEAVVKALNLYTDVVTFRNPEYQDLIDKYVTPVEGLTDYRTMSPFVGDLYKPQSRLINAEVINSYKATGVLDLDPRVSGDVNSIQGAYDWANNNTMSDWYKDKNEDEAGKYESMYVGHTAFDIVGNLYLEGEKSGVYKEKNQIFVGSTDSAADYGQMLLDLRNTAFLQIISGEKPIDYFDEFVEQWHNLGGEIITQEVNEIVGG